MPKKMLNQNTRISENEREFLNDVASSLGTNRSDVLRRMMYEWQRYGVSGTAESLRTCAGGTGQTCQVTPQQLQNLSTVYGKQARESRYLIYRDFTNRRSGSFGLLSGE